MPRPVVQTADGSITCFDNETGEHYHNKAGAFTEAKLNYVEPSGVIDIFRSNRKVSVLDVPFGLGYNTLVMLQQILELESDHNQPGEIDIVGIESDANILAVVERVLEDDRFKVLRTALNQGSQSFSKEAHDPETSTQNELAMSALLGLQPARFKLQNISVIIDVRHGDMRQVLPQLREANHKFDAIWHDPFSPNKMPELWTTDIFKVYRSMMLEHGRVCTYSVSVTTRGGLLEAGFNIYGSTPVGDKSGGTVASVQQFDSLPLGVTLLPESESLRLKTKSGVPFRDPTLDRARAEVRKVREIEQKNYGNNVAQAKPSQCPLD
jgi:tRNA U34 5-methylaminomethyl-2-thiouridine-forming methyltransferase MnmC